MTFCNYEHHAQQNNSINRQNTRKSECIILNNADNIHENKLADDFTLMFFKIIMTIIMTMHHRYMVLGFMLLGFVYSGICVSTFLRENFQSSYQFKLYNQFQCYL